MCVVFRLRSAPIEKPLIVETEQLFTGKLFANGAHNGSGSESFEALQPFARLRSATKSLGNERTKTIKTHSS